MPRPLLAAAAAAVALAAVPASTGAASPRVLRVGSWNGIPGTYTSIQAAVNAATPGDWVLVGPGDYKESPDATTGVRITTPDLHLRGMDRNAVVVDGTLPGTPACSAAPAAQDLKPGGRAAGRDGIVVFEADGVSVENLTACNFMGNVIWFNGGDGTGRTRLGAFRGAYLSVTSSFYGGPSAPTASYGLFVSNSHGPGVLYDTYASNMSDSDYYVGACPDCNVVIDRAHAQYSNLGYSGTNSGGRLVIENSEWDHNRTGIAPNSMNNDDSPPPQNGACPAGAVGPLGTASCTVIENNLVHDNDNPNVPGYSNPGLTSVGGGSSGPVGTGIYLVGSQNDTVSHNTVVHNGAWGIMVSDRPDQEQAPPASACQGGYSAPGIDHSVCYFPAFGNDIGGNLVSGNGWFGNPTDGDLADATLPHAPGNCWHGNVNPSGGAVTEEPPLLQETHGTCGSPNSGELLGPLGAEEACAVGLVPCPVPGTSYPEATAVVMPPLRSQDGMPDPCAGVPANPWCPTAGVQAASAGPATTVPSSAGAATLLPDTARGATAAWPAGAVAVAGAAALRRRRRGRDRWARHQTGSRRT